MLWKKPWTQIFSRQLKIAATRITFQDQLQWEEITRKTNRKVFHTKTTSTIWPPCLMEVIGEGPYGPSLTHIRVWTQRFLSVVKHITLNPHFLPVKNEHHTGVLWTQYFLTSKTHHIGAKMSNKQMFFEWKTFWM